jgi:hypothetical protein
MPLGMLAATVLSRRHRRGAPPVGGRATSGLERLPRQERSTARSASPETRRTAGVAGLSHRALGAASDAAADERIHAELLRMTVRGAVRAPLGVDGGRNGDLPVRYVVDLESLVCPKC